MIELKLVLLIDEESGERERHRCSAKRTDNVMDKDLDHVCYVFKNKRFV